MTCGGNGGWPLNGRLTGSTPLPSDNDCMLVIGCTPGALCKANEPPLWQNG